MEKHKMRCPYCNHVFEITEKQLNYNYRFRCPNCRRYNQGSASSEDGVLVGIACIPRKRTALED